MTAKKTVTSAKPKPAAAQALSLSSCGVPSPSRERSPEDPEEPALLVEFLINGSEEQEPYGLNGFGSGRMPAFGAILDQNDIDLLARYLRSGDLTGMGGE